MKVWWGLAIGVVACGCGLDLSGSLEWVNQFNDGGVRDSSVSLDAAGEGGDAEPLTDASIDAGNDALASTVPLAVFDHSLWTDYCIAMTACGIRSQDVGDCSSLVSLAIFPQPKNVLECVALAGADCNAVKRCLNNNELVTPCNSSSPPHCEGDVVVACSMQGERLAIDCHAQGLHCVGQAEAPGCGGNPCTLNSPQTSCSDGLAMTCGGGAYRVATDCRVYQNATCDPLNGCVGTGSQCSASSCDGDAYVQCLGGRQARTDCKLRGLKCFSDGCALGKECSVQSEPTRCDEDKLIFCNAGKRATFDCKKSGFRTCTASNASPRCTH